MDKNIFEPPKGKDLRGLDLMAQGLAIQSATIHQIPTGKNIKHLATQALKGSELNFDTPFNSDDLPPEAA